MKINKIHLNFDRRNLWQQNKKVLVASAIVLTVVLVAFGTWLGSGTQENGDIPVFATQRGPLTISVTESGTLKNREQVIVKNRVEGRRTILWLIPEGTYVKKGDKLVEIDGTNLADNKIQHQINTLNSEAAFIRARENLAVTQSQNKSDIIQAELKWKFSKLDLNMYLEGEFPQEVQQSEAAITIAKEELQRAEDKLDWSTRLAKEGYITRTELQADELACKKGQLDLELANGRLDLLKKYTHERQIEKLESDVEQAEMALGRIKRKASADLIQAEAELRAKELEYEKQQSKLVKIQRLIDDCIMLAPVDGMVVYATTGKGNWRGNKEPLAEGQDVRQREELIYLPTTSSMITEVKVHESSLRKVQKGMPVRIQVDALPGKTLFGRVGKIALLPDAQSAFLNPDLKVYTTEVYIDQDTGDLRAGMTCKVEIVVAEYPDELYVPIQAVTKVGNKHMVYVLADDEIEPRQVKVGLDNNRMIRILTGLTEGEKVLLNPPFAPSETGQGIQMDIPKQTDPTTQPAEAKKEEPAEPTTKPTLDPSKFKNMSQEQRKQFFESLTPEQQEQYRSKMRPNRGRHGEGQGRERGGESGRGGGRRRRQDQ